MLSDLVAARDHIMNLGMVNLHSKKAIAASQVIQSATFSDTIILFTKGASDSELRYMIILLGEIFHKALYRCVPIRAGLSCGKFFFNTELSMYAGPALIEAYRIGEAAQWIGISLADSIQQQANKLDMKSGASDIIVKWPVPVKNTGTEQRSVINWPAIFAHDLKITPPISVAHFYQAFERSFGPFSSLPAEVQAKYINTVNFMNQQLALHASA